MRGSGVLPSQSSPFSVNFIPSSISCSLSTLPPSKASFSSRKAFPALSRSLKATNANDDGSPSFLFSCKRVTVPNLESCRSRSRTFEASEILRMMSWTRGRGVAERGPVGIDKARDPMEEGILIFISAGVAFEIGVLMRSASLGRRSASIMSELGFGAVPTSTSIA